MEISENVAAWTALAAFLLPPVMAVINQPKWSPQIKSGLAFLACLGVAAVTTWLQGDFAGGDYITAALTALTVAQATYQGFWKPTGIAPGIEEGTSAGRRRRSTPAS
jgi:hypothetical protein